MLPEVERIAEFFASWIANNGRQGPTGAVAAWLSSGGLSPLEFERIALEGDASRDQWFRDQMLDLFLGYVAERVADQALTLETVADVHLLRKALEIHQGELVSRRSVEISALIQHVVDDVMSDDRIERSEELHLDGVQAAFDLSYDDFLRLARSALERARAELERRLENGNMRTADDQKLEVLCRLAEMQRRSLGALY
jgi:hypothetical protein